MIVTWILSFFTAKNAKPIIIALAVAIALAALGWFAYDSGYDKADALGKSTLATLQRQYSDSSANASMEAYQKLERETKRADKIAGELVTARNRLAQLKREISGGIPYAVAHTANCTFGPEFMELYNRAHGLLASTMPESSGTAGTTAQPGEAKPIGGGIRGGASVADLLAHGRDYGAYCQEVEAQRDGLKLLLMGGE